MKIKKLLLTVLCAVVGFGSSWAEDAYKNYLTEAKGWQEVTDLTTLDVSQYYFAIVCQNNTDLMVCTRSYGNSNNKFWYRNAADAKLDGTFLFTLTAAEGGKYTIACADMPDKYFASSESAYEVNATSSSTTGTKFSFTYDSSNKYYTIENEFSYDNGNNLGPWGNNFVAGDRLAGNKSGDAIGHFLLFAINKNYRKAVTDAATLENPQDVSFLLPDARVELTKGNSPWSGSNGMGGENALAFCPEYYNLDNVNVSQTVENLPNGVYQVLCNGFYRAGDNNTGTEQKAYLDVNGENVLLPSLSSDYHADNSLGGDQVTGKGWVPNSLSTAAKFLNNGHYKSSPVTVKVTDGTLTVAIKKDEKIDKDWMSYDNFQLIYYGNDCDVDDVIFGDAIKNYKEALNTAKGIIEDDKKMTASVKAALQTAVETYSEAKVIKEGMTEESLNTAKDALQTAIDNANASVAAYTALNAVLNDIYVDRSAAFGTEFTYRTEAQAMYDAATAATADVNAKASGMLNAYRDYVKGIAGNYPTVEGVKDARDANAWVFTTEATNKGNYNNPGNNDIGGDKMRENWKSGGLVAGDMKQTVSIPNGKYFLRMVSFTRKSPNAEDYIYIKSGEDIQKSISFGEPTRPNAFVNITNPIEVTNGEVEIGLHVGSGTDWAAIGGVVLYAYDVYDYPRTTAEGKYGTICLPYAATVEGAKIYSASINEEKTAVTLEAVEGDLVAGTPYIYQATADAQTFSYKEGNIVAAPVAADPLVGSFTNETISAGNYVLNTQNGKQAFYIVGEDGLAGKPYYCYLKVEASNARLDIVIDGETGINNLSTENGIIVDGKYMQNNKVVIVKNGRKYNVTGQLVK